MELRRTETGFALYKEKEAIGHCTLHPAAQGAALAALAIDPAWRRKGYGSYLLKEVLRSLGGYDKETATVFTAPLPADAGELAFWAKFGFAAEGSGLCRRRTPDLTAVKLVQDFLAARLADPRLCIDATCGNGHDTLFLCSVAGENGRVSGLDIQPQAAANTNALLAANGMAAIGRAECCDHRELLRFAPPGSADCVMFNFGWLPGAAHDVHSRAGRPEARRRACRGAVQRQGDRQCGKKGCGGVFPQPAAGRLYRADLRICQLGRYRSPALLCH